MSGFVMAIARVWSKQANISRWFFESRKAYCPRSIARAAPITCFMSD